MDLLNVTKLTRRGEVGSDATGVSVYSVTPAFKSVMDRLLAPLFVRGNPLVWAVNSVRRKGVLQTFKIVRRMVIDMGFDLRYGTNTMLWVQMDRLNFESEHKKHAA